MIYHGDDAEIEFPLLCFLLESKNYKILIDTGGSPPDGKHWMPYYRSADEELAGLLVKHQVDPDDIHAVIFTHLHWDHCGNNEPFRNAEFYVQKTEFDYIAETERPGYERHLILQYQYKLLEGDIDNLFPGISVISTPGHSIGSQSIIVNSDKGKVIFSGDLMPTYENIRLRVPNGGFYDLDMICGSVEKIMRLGIKILPGHDLRASFEKN